MNAVRGLELDLLDLRPLHATGRALVATTFAAVRIASSAPAARLRRQAH
jgi:hypothetical protein